ncbi:MAG: hypothetical protein ACLR2E_14475 [Lachnospiraceae bacterium]
MLAVVGFYWYLNQGTTDTTETMAEATFPLVYMKNGDSLLNCLHGYHPGDGRHRHAGHSDSSGK